MNTMMSSYPPAARSTPPESYGQPIIARHVIHTHFEPSLCCVKWHPMTWRAVSPGDLPAATSGRIWNPHVLS